MGRWPSNNKWNSEWFYRNCDDPSKLFERYLYDKVSINSEVSSSKLLDELYTFRNERFCLNQDLKEIVGKSFINQLMELGDVKPDTYLRYLNLIIMKDIFARGMGEKKLVGSQRSLKAFMNSIKVTIIQTGPKRTLEGIPVESILITLNPLGNKYNIRLDITTTNLYKLCLKIYTKKRSLNTFPFNSPQSLGQIIRYHKDSLIRQGFKISTYKRGSKHVVIEYVLNTVETESLLRNEINKGWY